MGSMGVRTLQLLIQPTMAPTVASATVSRRDTNASRALRRYASEKHADRAADRAHVPQRE